MSLGNWNYPIYCRRWKPGVSRYPIRWLAVDASTGCILEESCGVKAPTPRRPGVVVVPARLPGVPL